MGLQPQGRPLQELPSPSVVASTGGIASLVWRSLLVLGAVSTRRSTALDLEVFPVVQSPHVGHGMGLTTLGVRPSGESDLVAAAARAACCRGPSHEVSRLLQHDPPAESTHPEFASPGTFRLQGFAPSWRFAPRQATRPCSMPERSWSRMPFRAFPSSGAVSPLDDRCLLAVGVRRDAGWAGEGHAGTARPCPQGPPAPRDGLASLVRLGLCGFSVGARLQGLAPRSESVVAARLIRPKRRPLLSWASRPSWGHARPPPRLDVAADAPGMPDDALRCVPAPHPRPRPALDTGPRPRPKPLS